MSSNGFSLFERTQEELLALVSAYTGTARLCEDKSKALCYMAGETFKRLDPLLLLQN